MTTAPHVFSSQVIQSVKVRCTPRQSIFVITQDPALMDIVRELLAQEVIENGSIVWLTSIASACRRLERGEAAAVVVDGAYAADDEALNALYAASPDVRVRVLADETAPRRFV